MRKCLVSVMEIEDRDFGGKQLEIGVLKPHDHF